MSDEFQLFYDLYPEKKLSEYILRSQVWELAQGVQVRHKINYKKGKKKAKHETRVAS